jgi:hypothetical protein
MKYGDDYDWIWVFNQDTCLHPLQRNMSLSNAMSQWSSNRNEFVWSGPADISEGAMIYFTNFPFRGDMPCTDNFIISPKKAERLIRGKSNGSIIIADGT